MKKTLLSLLFLPVLWVTFSGCGKDDDSQEAQLPKDFILTLSMEHVYGMAALPFNLNQWFVHPRTNDSMLIHNIKYHLSHLFLIKQNGDTLFLQNAPLLFDVERPETLQVPFPAIPRGTYTGIGFAVGINETDLQEYIEVLPHDMRWTNPNHHFAIHLTGHSPLAPPDDFLFNFELGGPQVFFPKFWDLTANPIELNNNRTLIFNVNAARFWHGSTSISELADITEPSEQATQMAQDFADGFIVKEIN